MPGKREEKSGAQSQKDWRGRQKKKAAQGGPPHSVQVGAQRLEVVVDTRARKMWRLRACIDMRLDMRTNGCATVAKLAGRGRKKEATGTRVQAH